MKNPSNNELLVVCEKTARMTGTHALVNLHRRDEVAALFAHDVKLVMDSECQRVAETIIHSHFPGHAILGEEGCIATEHTFEWIIDPIDGTANYSRGFPFWCCSVAVRRDSEILAGCVFVPVLNECYTATVDGPALCNGKPISASSIPTLENAVFSAGLTKDIDPHSLSFFSDMAPRVSKMRMLGSAAIDLCHVACGRTDGYFESGIYLWDVAAAGLIAERAGALCVAWPRDEEHGVRFLCTNPQIHAETRIVVEKNFTAVS